MDRVQFAQCHLTGGDIDVDFGNAGSENAFGRGFMLRVIAFHFELKTLVDRGLGQLCERMGMSRQAVSQHLALLEEANLVSTSWRGREKLHFLNPVPIHEIYDRWVKKFERMNLKALDQLKKQLEGERHD